jgi:hypothetical protein
MGEKFHYYVHVLPKEGNLDVTLWVGLTLDHQCNPDGSDVNADSVYGTHVPNDSELAQLAIARAKELCPLLAPFSCFCEEWSVNKERTPIK